MSGFTFGTGGGTVTGGGFNFSTPSSTITTTTSSTPGFSFAVPTTTTSSGGFKFSGFGATTATTTATTTTTTTTTTSGTSSFSFNLNPSTTAAGTGASLFNLSTSTVAPSQGTGSFNFGKTVSSTTGTILGTTCTSTFSFAPPASSASLTASAPLTLNTTPASAALPTQPISGPSSIVGPSASLTTSTTTTSFGASGAGGSTNLSMRQLEERLNKWLVELKEQEERFVRQAAHVNAWDQILQNGHDQVQSLKDTLHTVKSDQSRLEAEIDFIRGQQEELERLLEPLESATNVNPATQLHQGDRQRDNMYYLAQSLDAQLRQMTDDLGKVIEHLNTNSGSWQPNDPVTLVARILSAHMDTLKWVDQNTSLLSQKVEEVARVAANAGKRG